MIDSKVDVYHKQVVLQVFLKRHIYSAFYGVEILQVLHFYSAEWC